MSHRRPEARQPGLERALKHALRLAVDSVEPGADGLDRIRAKIVAQPHVRTGWQTTYLTALLRVLSTVGRFGEPAVIWLRYWTGAVAERFRPDLRRVGWLGWLRPAAAVATGLLVVAGASWAITTLPQIAPSGNPQKIGSGGGTGAPPSAHHGSQPGGGAQPSGSGSSSSPRASTSCRPSSPAPSTRASSIPTQSSSPSPSASSSPSPSPSPSTTPSTTPTGSPTPSGSPSVASSAASSVSLHAIQSALAAGGLQLDAAAVSHPGVTAQAGRSTGQRPLFSTRITAVKPSPGAHGRRSPQCAR